MASEIYQRMVHLSGPYRDLKTTTSQTVGREIYGSFHLPQFKKTNAQRNTLIRFNEFLVPDDLSQYSVFDLGSNLGSISFECLRRGCRSLHGFEYSKERVQLCKDLLNHLQLQSCATFNAVDLNDFIGAPEANQEFFRLYGQADIVFCCALDAYLDRASLYELVGQTTRRVCYFETNSGIAPSDFKTNMKQWFSHVIHLGTSKSDAGYGRHSYILVKDDQAILSSKIYGNEYDHITYKILDRVLVQYFNNAQYDHLQRLYTKIRDIPGVIRMTFPNPMWVETPFYDHPTLAEYLGIIPAKEYHIIRQRLIEFVKGLITKGVCHRDIHGKNILWDRSRQKIIVIDWEYIEEDTRGWPEHYDITGLHPHDYRFPSQVAEEMFKHTSAMHVFSPNEHSLIRLMADLQKEDFMP